MTGKGQRIGYVRVSSYDQNPDRQVEQLDVDRVYTDKASGKDTDRPKLQELLGYAREGDTIVVHSMDRLARNVDDLRRIVQQQTKRGVCVQFVKENLTFSGDTSPMADLMLSVLGAVAQFERDLIRERQREGIALARERGVYRGRKKALTPEQTADLRRRVRAGEKKAALAREFGISRETLYQYARAPGPDQPPPAAVDDGSLRGDGQKPSSGPERAASKPPG
jgi:DNA invertase Pin-like site-specific DNA recombinase